MIHKALRNIKLVSVIFVVTICATLFACTQGNTDGSDDAETSGTGKDGRFTSTGSSGSQLTIIAPEKVAVGDTSGYRVIAQDPSNRALKNLLITCDSEQGIAILEPTTGVEHTDDNGQMSGVLGLERPGSYVFECRASGVHNLIARTTIIGTGTIPEGFNGFAGAAGGGLGGGRVTDDDTANIRILSLEFTDAGGTSKFGTIDTARIGDCDGDSTTDDPEPFTNTQYTIKIKNTSKVQRLKIESVKFEINDGAGSQTGTLNVNAEAAPDSEVAVNGLFINGVPPSQVYTGSSNVVTSGTHAVKVTVRGRLGSGDSITLQSTQTVTFGSVDNC
ncbi:hypothetical protein JNK13_04460 [bacterium]|nr:hypothetical protein [bacterium]